MHNDLRGFLQSFAAFNSGETDQIIQYFKPEFVNKNEYLLREGNICHAFYYVRSGSLRTFYMDKNGREKTRYIILDNEIGTTLHSFITQTPSIEFIEALEDTSVLVIDHSDFFRLVSEMGCWKNFYLKILEKAYTFQNKKIESLVTMTTRQRYEKMRHEKPEFMQRLSNKVLASYLDMREETLSRLKSI